MILEVFQAAGDNLCYLVGDVPCGSALLIDPVNWNAVLSAVKKYDLSVKVIVNTHTHPDHTAGNNFIMRETKAPLAVHSLEAKVVRAAIRLEDGDALEAGILKAEVLHTPGHTVGSICVLVEVPEGKNYIFTGDTLFLAGCGNTRFGGNINALFESLTGKLMMLPDDIVVCAGHDYAVRNLQFSLSREPDNKSAQKKLEDVLNSVHEGRFVFSTIGEEKSYNPFFRFRAPSIISRLKAEFPKLGEDDFQIFAKLRELRNSW